MNTITINYQPCESSQVAEWGYHAESKTFGVKFHGKPGDPPSTYHYFDVPQSIADDAARAESMGRFVNTALKGGKFRYERQPDEPGGIVFGLSQKQEPKYTTSSKTGRIVNRSTGVAIPDDEPVFVLRGKDRNAAIAIQAYLSTCQHPDHRAVVKSRLQDFCEFSAAHPDRMKEPDSSLQDIAGANVGRAPYSGNRGFASMDPQRQREIASEGGRAAHEKGTAHEFTSEEAREAGRSPRSPA